MSVSLLLLCNAKMLIFKNRIFDRSTNVAHANSQESQKLKKKLRFKNKLKVMPIPD